MSFETLVNEARSLTQAEKLNLLTAIVEMLKISARDEVEVKDCLVFPHIDTQMAISDDIMNMVVGKLPDNFDVDKATEEMWEYLAK